MSRSFSSAVTAQVAAKNALPRRLFRLHLDSGILCYTDHTSDIVFQGVTYHARRASHSPVNTYMGKQADTTTVTIDDVDGQPTGYAVAEDFEGRKLEIWQVFLSPQLGVIDGLAVTPTFLRTGVAWKKDGTQVATGIPRYETGADGLASGAIMSEAPAANIFYPSALSTTETSGGPVGEWASTYPVQALMNLQTNMRRVARTGSTTWTFAEWAIAGITAVAHAVSFYIKNDTAVGITEIGFIEVTAAPQRFCRVLIAWSGAAITSVTAANNNWSNPTTVGYELVDAVNNIYRVWFTTPADPNNTKTPRFRIIPDDTPGAVTDRAVFVGGVQIEATAFHTSTIPTTVASVSRNGETIQEPTASTVLVAQGSVVVWAYITSEIKLQVSGRYPSIFKIQKTAGDFTGIELFHRPDAATWHLRSRDDVNADTSIQVNDSYTPNGWHQFIVCWSASILKLYIDGTLRGSQPTPKLPSAFQTNLQIGLLSNTLVDDFQTINRILTDAEATAMYALGAPSQETPETTALIRFNNALTSDDKIVQFNGKMDMPEF